MEDLSSRGCDLFQDPRATLLTYLDGAEDPLMAEAREGRRLADSLLRQLQNSPEPLPGLYCQMLGLPARTTCGEAATYLLRQIGNSNEA